MHLWIKFIIVFSCAQGLGFINRNNIKTSVLCYDLGSADYL